MHANRHETAFSESIKMCLQALQHSATNRTGSCLHTLLRLKQLSSHNFTRIQQLHRVLCWQGHAAHLSHEPGYGEEAPLQEHSCGLSQGDGGGCHCIGLVLEGPDLRSQTLCLTLGHLPAEIDKHGQVRQRSATTANEVGCRLPRI